MNARGMLRTLGQARLAFVVPGAGILISGAAWYLAEQRVQAEAASGFQQRAAQAIETIDRYAEADVDLAIGLKGLFHAGGHVRRDEFRTYLSGFRLRER